MGDGGADGASLLRRSGEIGPDGKRRRKRLAVTYAFAMSRRFGRRSETHSPMRELPRVGDKPFANVVLGTISYRDLGPSFVTREVEPSYGCVSLARSGVQARRYPSALPFLRRPAHRPGTRARLGRALRPRKPRKRTPHDHGGLELVAMAEALVPLLTPGGVLDAEGRLAQRLRCNHGGSPRVHRSRHRAGEGRSSLNSPLAR